MQQSNNKNSSKFTPMKKNVSKKIHVLEASKISKKNAEKIKGGAGTNDQALWVPVRN